MIAIYVDTSAIVAIINRRDVSHLGAKAQWENLLSSDSTLLCSNYVIVESIAIIQRRLGIEALRVFQEDIVPLINIEWVDEQTHCTGTTALLAAAKRELSLTDCISFSVMRRLGVKDAFTYDKHFAEEGFNCLT